MHQMSVLTLKKSIGFGVWHDSYIRDCDFYEKTGILEIIFKLTVSTYMWNGKKLSHKNNFI